MAKSQQQDNNYYPTPSNEVLGQVPDQLPPMPMMAQTGFDYAGAQAMAKELADVKGNKVKQENAYDAKKMERMVKGMSLDQQTAMARQFNHFALLEGLKYQFEHLDELEADINSAFAKLAVSREER